MKKLLFYIFCLFSFTSSGQTYKIEFERINFKEYEGGKTRINPTVLYLDSTKSVFLEDQVINGYNSEVELEQYRNNQRTGKKIKGDSLGQVIIKFRADKKIKQRRKVADYKKGVYAEVVDSLYPEFNWELKNEFREILGHVVQKATTTYKERDIVAWFAPSIPLSDGPWKFSQLPGIILEVDVNLTKDSHVQYKAVSISQVDSMPEVSLPKERLMTLNEIQEGYHQRYRDLYRYYTTKTTGELSLRKDDLDFEPIIFN